MSSSLSALAFFLAGALAVGLSVLCVSFLAAGLALAVFLGAALALGFYQPVRLVVLLQPSGLNTYRRRFWNEVRAPAVRNIEHGVVHQGVVHCERWYWVKENKEPKESDPDQGRKGEKRGTCATSE